ncbi:TetR/AcrR family transcriptional regulator [Nocardiopsis alborubida]|uniref:TetR/AcrR family transcriptional regulator n=1 Tax=Nocardiopsis alborubida TaxID=146802 RepID=A0A7X6MEE1_9ACTN|nr:TetR/AcrR family transcriptional regulator [Nocardiopsis alborubida]NKY99539.1 TetR/AcrR family transcriptional regulator [Nocardiopsis alborubida]
MAYAHDPTATLELLWNGPRRPRRGPRHNLTAERVVEAAMEVAEQEGVDALSMRRVAARLGVGAATLYTYVPDKSALIALMVDTMVGQAVLPHTRTGTWREKVWSWAHEDLRSYREHPWLVELTGTGQPVGPHTFAWADSAVRVFDGTGLSGHEALTVVEAVDGYVRGHVALVVQADRAEAWTAPDGRTWDTVQEAFLAARAGGAGRYPAIERMTTAGPTPEEAFSQGLDWLLDGVELRVRSRAAERS